MVLIREANRNDVEGILDLWEEFTTYLQRLEPEFFELKDNARDIYRRMLKKFLKFPEYHIVIAEDSGQLVGYHIVSIRYPGEVFVQDPYGHVSDLYLKDGYRGKDYGEQLLRASKQWLKERGVSKMDVKTFLENPKGKRFWEKNGFAAFEVAYKSNLEKNLSK